MQPSNALDPEDGSYEELLAMWADLEAGLSVVLLAPGHIPDFQKKIGQYDGWMRGLLERDTDIALYLLFQLAATSTTGYSASHALVCAVLCHITALELKLPAAERDSLVHAAMTMNVSITSLQNELAVQSAKLSGSQRAALHQHGARSRKVLADRGVADPLWLDVVAAHHDELEGSGAANLAPQPRRLAQLLQMIDRYGAMISPRKSRSARSVSESLREVVTGPGGRRTELGDALVRAVGVCPPGSFVRLTNGETAVVLRRGDSPEDPVLAVLVDPQGRPTTPPRLHQKSAGAASVLGALSGLDGPSEAGRWTSG
ncbi:MAG: phosphodiesterase [Burkholderiales bacterium]